MKRFYPVRQQEELVGATELRLTEQMDLLYSNTKDPIQSRRT